MADIQFGTIVQVSPILLVRIDKTTVNLTVNWVDTASLPQLDDRVACVVIDRSVAVLSVLGSSYSSGSRGRINQLDNGDFAVHQRASDPNGTAYAYWVDRWETVKDGFNTGMSYSTHTLSPPFARTLRWGPGPGITGLGSYVSQSLETSNVRRIAGNKVTLSFSAWNVTTTCNLEVKVRSSAAINGNGLKNGGGGWTDDLSVTQAVGNARYVFTTPNIIPTTARSLEVRFRLMSADAGGSFVDLNGVQLEIGSVATPFEFRRYSDDLADCMRFFQLFGRNGVNELYGNGYGIDTVKARIVLPTVVPMRATPTVTFTGNNKLITDGAAYAVTSCGIGSSSSLMAVYFDATVASGIIASYAYAFGSNNDINASTQLSADL